MSKRTPREIPVLYGLPNRKIRLLLVCAFLFLFGFSWLRQARAAESDRAETARNGLIATLLLEGMVQAAVEESRAVHTHDTATDLRLAAGNLAVVSIPRAAPLQRGKILVVGRVAGNGLLATAELFDSVSNTWLTAATLTAGRGNRMEALPRTGKCLVWGGIIIPF